MNSISVFTTQQFPSNCPDTTVRRNTFQNFLLSLFSTEIDVDYKFVSVVGDGNCFFHAILRYFGFLNWMDLPNKDTIQMNEEEQMKYTVILSNLRLQATEYFRILSGDNDFELDFNVPEYQSICRYISDSMNLRIVVIEYNAYETNKINLNRVQLFEPANGGYADSAILINLSNHFTLVFPTSTNPLYDTKTIREIATNSLISKAIFENKML